jgi:hypothetical protein
VHLDRDDGYSWVVAFYEQEPSLRPPKSIGPEDCDRQHSRQSSGSRNP